MQMKHHAKYWLHEIGVRLLKICYLCSRKNPNCILQKSEHYVTGFFLRSKKHYQ